MKVENSDIDIVILWVDNNDSRWINQKMEYSANTHEGDNSEIRYRDWELMKFWFRSIEKNAPWVRKIHLVTYGHIPSFLDTNHPKINIVNHKDIMNRDYLPTFNSCSIEININNIRGLSEHFIYFNDDTFLTQPITPEYYFQNNLPVLEGIENVILPNGDNSEHTHILLNDMEIINRNFSKRTQVRKNFLKWFSPKYKLDLIRTLALLPWSKFVGFKNDHLPTPLRKSTMNYIWNKEFTTLNNTSKSKFRENNNVNQYLFKYWELASGNFIPKKQSGKFFYLTDSTLNQIVDAITNKKYSVICINDTDHINNFEKCKTELITAFNSVYSQKSSFEK